MGDPAGVGPELCLRALIDADVTNVCTPVVFGDADVLTACAQKLGWSPPSQVITSETLPAVETPAVWHLPQLNLSELKPGQISADTGQASYHYIQQAIAAALASQVAAVTTAPISKEALHRAGHHYPGHTEIFAEQTHAARSCMMQYSDEITCSFVTTHIGYHEVPAHLTTARILEVLELTVDGLTRIRQRPPRIVVCGLNPHAGEHGLFGQREEERLIQPAIDAGRARGWQIEGPVPADTAFVPAKRRTTDAFVCMYHDQGHIPVKALAFDRAVNTTLGLPIVRTSVDHGTAIDIAWQGLADPGSLFAALRLATQLAR
ncbi:4-hydroxythreonine-4-phosphate dehydrogenase PdxA [bacterium]|nr:4-hydroxythreonine-4-phosphate dehydrogenase PdxA [bacterium]